jgi:protein TonB
MDLDAWNVRPDSLRARRLALGSGVGLVTVASFVVLVALTQKPSEIEKDDDVVEVKLEEKLPEQAEAEPEPEPEPVTNEQVAAPGPRLALLRPPTEIPQDKPSEAEPTQGEGEGGTADPYAATGGRGRTGGAGTAQVEAPKEAPKPPPVKPRATSITEDMTPPKPISQAMPAFPDALKAQGIEGVVIVKYVIGVDGTVTAAKRVRGPSEFWPVIAAAMKSWKFSPALDASGKPVSVTRTHRFNFTIKTD